MKEEEFEDLLKLWRLYLTRLARVQKNMQGFYDVIAENMKQMDGRIKPLTENAGKTMRELEKNIGQLLGQTQEMTTIWTKNFRQVYRFAESTAEGLREPIRGIVQSLEPLTEILKRFGEWQKGLKK